MKYIQTFIGTVLISLCFIQAGGNSLASVSSLFHQPALEQSSTDHMIISEGDCHEESVKQARMSDCGDCPAGCPMMQSVSLWAPNVVIIFGKTNSATKVFEPKSPTSLAHRPSAPPPKILL
ncbi:hypothetical protein QGN29_05535 [Temperatibacter marinus]|uniref:Uncharacterized protein n=1 Tax=Temperatibacter marinus TaxID=1456591 RepID=A0AA52EJA8_9PROT|nr:hypothetical protein [Temperatibacter marinus]WND03835.1 hypothetical protein QGN29_05535 [Temperatibacter marinus]